MGKVGMNTGHGTAIQMAQQRRRLLVRIPRWQVLHLRQQRFTPRLGWQTIARLGGKDSREQTSAQERRRLVQGKGFRTAGKAAENQGKTRVCPRLDPRLDHGGYTPNSAWTR
jgi:hypothetical protein